MSKRVQHGLLVEWVNSQRRQKHLTGLLASIDFTYTSGKSTRSKTYGLKGSAQQQSALTIPQHTNCIVTMVWSDGVNRTPARLYTFNPKFAFGRVSKLKRFQLEWDAQEAHLRSCARRNKIAHSRFVYVGKGAADTRLYVGETADIVRDFLGAYKDVILEADPTIFHDSGGAFNPEGKSVFNEFGLFKHHTYPSAVHHYLSPNDNRLHGTAKSAWRASKSYDRSDDVASSLFLLSLLDRDTEKHSRTWFDRNMLSLTEDSAWLLVRDNSNLARDLVDERLRAYRIFIGENALGAQRSVPAPLQGALDGRAWMPTTAARRKL